MAVPPKQLVNYHDVQVYESDVHLFSTNAWLNDNCINFYFMYLYQTVCQASNEWLLVDPAVVAFVMLQCEDQEELQEFSHGVALHTKKKVLIPVNDTQYRAQSGTHWSLLEWHTTTNTFYHYDSCHPTNMPAAQRVAETFGSLVHSEVKLLPVVDSPQQTNGYDCGMYVLLTAEWLCRHPERTISSQKFVTENAIQHKRQEIPKIIEELINMN